MRTPSLFVAVLFGSTAQAAVLLVDDDAPDGDDGQRWTTAFRDLQDALAVAEPGDEVWVAAGTYRPDRGTGDRMAAFQLTIEVHLYGGFDGTETARDQRDPAIRITTLTGDLNDDDGPNFANSRDNSLHVVTESGTDDTWVLDGFTITAAIGGGVVGVRGATLVNCTFIANRASGDGGGLNGFADLINCAFVDNTAGNGGGAIAGGGSMINCTFRLMCPGWCNSERPIAPAGMHPLPS